MDNYEEINKNVENNNAAVVAMVLGILSIVLCWVPIISLILAIVALVCSAKGFKNAKTTNKGRGFSIAGLSCGSVGIVFSIIYTILWIFMGFMIGTAIDIFDEELKGNSSYRYEIENSSQYYKKSKNILDEYDY